MAAAGEGTWPPSPRANSSWGPNQGRGVFVLAEKYASVCEPPLELLRAGPSAQVSTQLSMQSCLPWAFFLEASPSPTRSTCYRTFRPCPTGGHAQTHNQAAPVLTSPQAITLTSPAAWPHLGPGRQGVPFIVCTRITPAAQILADSSHSPFWLCCSSSTVAGGWGGLGGIRWSLRLSPSSSRPTEFSHCFRPRKPSTESLQPVSGWGQGQSLSCSPPLGGPCHSGLSHLISTAGGAGQDGLSCPLSLTHFRALHDLPSCSVGLPRPARLGPHTTTSPLPRARLLACLLHLSAPSCWWGVSDRGQQEASHIPGIFQRKERGLLQVPVGPAKSLSWTWCEVRSLSIARDRAQFKWTETQVENY